MRTSFLRARKTSIVVTYFKALSVSVGVLLAPSCSRETRALRSIRASSEASLRAESLLIAATSDFREATLGSASKQAAAEGNSRVEEAHEWAKRSVGYANKAQILPPAHPHFARAGEQLARARLLERSFQDPEAVVHLWWQSVGEANLELGRCFFDTRQTAEKALAAAGKEEHAMPETLKRFDEALTRSMNHLYEKYGASVAAMKIKTSVIDAKDDNAGVQCDLELNGKPISGARFTLHLVRQHGLWKIFDMSTTFGASRDRRLTEVFAGQEMNAAIEILEGSKDLSDALSKFEAARDMAPSFAMEKPRVDWYARLIRPTKLTRAGKEETLDKKTLLKIADQYSIEGIPSVLVCTTEADPRARAVGMVPEDSVTMVGTDESTMWDIDASADE